MDLDPTRKYKCDQCSKKYGFPYLLKRHQDSHSSDKKFKCSKCDKTFAQKFTLTRHIKEQHSHTQEYNCQKCFMKFSKKFNLKCHIKRVHKQKDVKEMKEPTFKCTHCSCVYSFKSALSRHFSTHHMGNKSSSALDSSDPQILAANIVQELKDLQMDMFSNQNLEDVTAVQSHSLETENSNTTKEIKTFTFETLIQDKLYPDGNANSLKVKVLKKGRTYFYVCDFCSKEFRKVYNFIRHRRHHTRERPFKCEICQKSYPTASSLHQHKASHMPDDSLGSHKCPVCEVNYSTIKSLDEHLSSHLPHQQISFNCTECSKTFSTLKSYSKHKHLKNDPELKMLKELLPSPIYLEEIRKQNICSDGEKTTVVEKGQKIRQITNKIKCQKCQRSFSTASSLKIHQNIHLELRTHKCSLCSRSFCTKYQLQRHQLSHSLNKNFQCRYCEKRFKSAEYCRLHMTMHIKDLLNLKTAKDSQYVKETKTYFATILNSADFTMQTTNLQTLETSKRTQTESKAQKLNSSITTKCSCLECAKNFKYASQLKDHKLRKHFTGNFPFQCANCSKSFARKFSLKEHSKIHQPQKESADDQPSTSAKFTCQVCGKTFSWLKSMRLHLRLHTNKLPFKCQECPREFRTSGHLKQHIKSNHQIKQYSKCQN